jgi:flagellar hook-associated protein FlgK
MMAAQQAYSANAQVITAVNKMFDTLINSISR